MKKCRKIFIFLLVAALILLPVTAYAAYTPSFTLQSVGVYVKNLDTGEVMFEQNADERIFHGYLTKLMTALVVLDQARQQEIDIDTHTARLTIHIQNIVYGSSSLAGIYNGDELTLHDLLYAMLMQSANEAALILADCIGDGSQGHFVDMMNQKAKDLGCTNTNFTDAAGFADEQTYTTARDLSLIFSAAMEEEVIVDALTTLTQDITVQNTGRSIRLINYINPMQRQANDNYYSPMECGMAESSSGLTRNMVSRAASDGYHYQVAVLGAPAKNSAGGATSPSEYLHYYETRELYRWAFENFSVRTVTRAGDLVAEVPVKYAKGTDFLRLQAGEQFLALMENSIQLTSVQYQYELPDYAAAPVAVGEPVGILHIFLADQEIGQVKLLAADEIEASSVKRLLGSAGNWLHVYWVKFVICLVFLLIVELFWVRANNLRRRARKRAQGGQAGRRYL